MRGTTPPHWQRSTDRARYTESVCSHKAKVLLVLDRDGALPPSARATPARARRAVLFEINDDRGVQLAIWAHARGAALKRGQIVYTKIPYSACMNSFRIE